MKYYNDFDFYNMTSNGGLTIINNFQTFQQSKDNTCGPTCVRMVLNYFGDNDFSESDLEKICKTKDYPIGTTLNSLVEGIENVGYKTISTFDFDKDKEENIFETFEDFKEFIKENLQNQTPIIVLNCDYGGHYKVIIGYDEVNENSEEDILIFADPSDINDGKIDGYNFFPADRFFYMWFDYQQIRGYIKQPFVVIKQPE